MIRFSPSKLAVFCDIDYAEYCSCLLLSSTRATMPTPLSICGFNSPHLSARQLHPTRQLPHQLPRWKGGGSGTENRYVASVAGTPFPTND